MHACISTAATVVQSLYCHLQAFILRRLNSCDESAGEVSTAVAAQPEPEQADAEATVSVKAPSSGEKRKRSEMSVGVSAGDENAETATTDTPVEKRFCVEQQQSESEVVAEVLHQA